MSRHLFGVIQLGRPQENAPVPITGHERLSPELLKHIFAKTNTPRQGDLLRLYQNATPGIRRPQLADQ